MGTADEWLKPTLLGAAFDTGDIHTARALCDQIARDDIVSWKLDTTVSDLRAALALLPEETTRAALAAICDELDARARGTFA